MSTLDPLWYAWNGITCTGTTASTVYVPYDNGWREWHRLNPDRVVQAPTPRAPQPLYGAAAEAQRYWRDQELARKAAAERAEKLLLKCLNEEERHCYLTHGFFDVLGSDGLIYRIQKGTHGNVREMQAGPGGVLRSVARLCCQPEGVPEADANLAQALWLKHDAPRFRRVANITQLPVLPGTPLAPVTERQFFNGRMQQLALA